MLNPSFLEIAKLEVIPKLIFADVIKQSSSSSYWPTLVVLGLLLKCVSGC